MWKLILINLRTWETETGDINCKASMGHTMNSQLAKTLTTATTIRKRKQRRRMMMRRKVPSVNARKSPVTRDLR